MIINMTTIAVRTKHYIDRTLESLFASDGRHFPVNLILGSRDSSHVEKYRGTLNIVTWDEASEARARPGRMRYNCNLNALRALRYGDDENCLCCEDDVRFKEDWYSQLLLTIEQIGHRDFVLNLGQGCDQSPDKRYAVHTRSTLVGAQAIFYPTKELRTAVADYLEENILSGMNDNLVGRYAKKYSALYNTTPMLVDHIGQVSSFSLQPPPPPPEAASPEAPAASVPPPGPSPTRVEVAPAIAPRTAAREAADPARSRGRLRATSEVFLELLRASLGSGAPPDKARLDECDWRRLAQMGTDHKLTPVLHAVLPAGGAGVPDEWRRKFKAPYVANVFHSQLAQKSVDEIGKAFAEEGIELTLLNGAALQRCLYDDQALRVVGAIDLLVDCPDVERASARLQLLGLNPLERATECRPLSRFHRVHLAIDAAAIPVDLYWRPFEPYQPYVFDRDAVRARARPLAAERPNVLVMAPEHELAHLCLRIDQHAVVVRTLMGRNEYLETLHRPRAGERLVRLYDVALCVRKRGPSIDWDGLLDASHRWAIDAHVGAALELAQRVFDVGPPPEVLRELNRRRPRLVDRIAHRMMLASHRADEMSGSGPASSARSRRLERLSTHAVRLARAFNTLFPPRAYLHAKYAGSSSPPQLWALHAREVVPGLWAEARERLMSAALTDR